MVNGGMPATTYINNTSGSQGVGNIRFNTSSQNLEVYDGYSWQQLTMGHASIGLTPDAESAMSWAIKRQREEAELAILAETNPAIRDLIKQKEKLDDQIKMVQTLTKDYTVGTN